jgi:hypothetical protein
MGIMNKIKGTVASVAIVLTAGIGLAACNSNSSTTAPKPTTTTQAPAPAVAATPVPAPPAPPAPPAAPAMTAGQQQAVTSAQGYLTDGEGFSYAGLLQQLTSASGEGFPTSDATFALNYLHPDWNAQAVIAAKGYLADGEGFSQSGLEQQLSSSYGDGFTNAQAEYGTTQAFAAQG